MFCKRVIHEEDYKKGKKIRSTCLTREQMLSKKSAKLLMQALEQSGYEKLDTKEGTMYCFDIDEHSWETYLFSEVESNG